VTHSGLLTHISAALTTQTVAYVGRFDAAEPFLSSILINAELPPFGSLNLGSHGGAPVHGGIVTRWPDQTTTPSVNPPRPFGIRPQEKNNKPQEIT